MMVLWPRRRRSLAVAMRIAPAIAVRPSAWSSPKRPASLSSKSRALKRQKGRPEKPMTPTACDRLQASTEKRKLPRFACSSFRPSAMLEEQSMSRYTVPNARRRASAL